VERSFRLSPRVKVSGPKKKIGRYDFFLLRIVRKRAFRTGLARAKLYGPTDNEERGIGSSRASKNVRNSWVIFRICDAYVPEPVQVLMELHGKDQLEGKVIDVSDAGSHGEAFAVVEVQGLSQPVVVPVKHIREGGSRK